MWVKKVVSGQASVHVPKDRSCHLAVTVCFCTFVPDCQVDHASREDRPRRSPEAFRHFAPIGSMRMDAFSTCIGR
ncbi:unnamed protein product [Protopolystoma xenopodis]|uniref:Uncharacterized protein n=1 Tax=Protopolystoma xenopodis TaxID=117903 RepID=A0A448XLE9_9PLAT|nr:unnamed protein product [Protopolystoma xenopodis]